METDFSARSAGPRALGAERGAHGRYADIGRLLITCPDRPGIVDAVPSFLITSGASITGSQECFTDPFGGIVFLRIGFHLDALAELSLIRRPPLVKSRANSRMRWQMTTVGGEGAPREVCG